MASAPWSAIVMWPSSCVVRSSMKRRHSATAPSVCVGRRMPSRVLDRRGRAWRRPEVTVQDVPSSCQVKRQSVSQVA